MIRLFTGYDSRESVGWHVFCQSVIENTSAPVSIVPVTERTALQLGASSDGTNAFSKARFLVPHLCGFAGWALWLDGADMLVRGDLAELWKLRDEGAAVQVVQHDYTPRHARKYVGTAMESDNGGYPRKNWSSAVLWNCGHLHNRVLTADAVRQMPGPYLHRFSWTESVGVLPAEWNWLDEYEPRDAKLIHYTNGIPGFRHYREAQHAPEWREQLNKALNGLQE